MEETRPLNPEFEPLKKWIHDLNNRVGVILGMAELQKGEDLSPRAEKRRETIEQQAFEVRDILQAIAGKYLGG